MATTSGNLAAGKTTIGGPRKNGTGGRFGLRARVAASVATIGCAAALAVGGLGAGDIAPPRSQSAPAAYTVQASTIDERTQQRFLEQNQLPEGIVRIAATTYEQRRFLEQNQLPTGAPAFPVTTEERRFLEQNQLPGDTTPTTALDDPHTMPR